MPAPTTFEQRYRPAQRGNLNPFYDSPAWRACRAMVRNEEPICRACQRKPTAIIDHIKPLDQRPDLALVRTNLQGLCRPCHNRKHSKVAPCNDQR